MILVVANNGKYRKYKWSCYKKLPNKDIRLHYRIRKTFINEELLILWIELFWSQEEFSKWLIIKNEYLWITRIYQSVDKIKVELWRIEHWIFT